MTVANVDALRLENEFLRQSLAEKKSNPREILDMQKKFNQVLELSEVRRDPEIIDFSILGS